MECLRKKKFVVTFKIWLFEKQGHIPLNQMLLMCQRSFIFTMCLYVQGDWPILENRYKNFSQPVETKIMRKRMNQSVWTISARGFQHASSLARWNRLYINTKTYYPADWVSPAIGIFITYKHPARSNKPP